MHSTQFRRDPEGVADPAPLTTRPRRTNAEILAEMEAEQARNRALPVIYGPVDERTTAAKLLADARSRCEEIAAERGEKPWESAGYLVGYLSGIVERLCVDLNAAQTKPGLLRARLAYQRRIDREAKARARAAQ